MPENEKSSLYLESTIPSYLAAHPSRDLIVAAHQLFWADRLLLDGRYLGPLLAG